MRARLSWAFILRDGASRLLRMRFEQGAPENKNPAVTGGVFIENDR
jgi:hypothetical protein